MGELFDKEVNAQKESLKKLQGFTQAPTYVAQNEVLHIYIYIYIYSAWFKNHKTLCYSITEPCNCLHGYLETH